MLPNVTNFRAGCVMIGATLLLIPACSVNVNKSNSGEDKNVDIKTPMGAIHVNNDADVRDTGLPVYPGARPKEKEKNDEEKSANVNISAFGFGLHVVALEYESDDLMEKVVSFYQDKLKKYGNVLECHNDRRHSVSANRSRDSNGSDELKCEGDDHGKNVELKAGSQQNQHVVSIEPASKGCTFSLVYVRTHGKDDTI
ncbi:MAG: hypothetical protein JOY93_07445 [Acidobacteriales bacterium]|nr:hypothetical protein [Terriglobales bacterium]